MSLCQCGCGEEAKEGNMYLQGHYQKMQRKVDKPDIKPTKPTKTTTESPLLDILNMSKDNLDNISKNKLLIEYLFIKEVVLEIKEIKQLLKGIK